MCPDFFCKLLHSCSQLWVPLSKHIANACEIVLILYQQLVSFQLLRGNPFHNSSFKSSSAEIFGKGDSCPGRSSLKQLLLVNRAADLDVFPFHFFLLKTLQPPGAKQDCHYNDTSCFAISNEILL